MSFCDKEYASVDVFKFLAAILIVAIHTNPFSGSVIDYYFTCFCRIGVPFFFIASSFFFFKKNHPNIKQYTLRLSKLYILWFLIELPLIYHYFFIEANYSSMLIKVLNLIRSILFSNTWGASWFVMASILSVNIVFFLSRKLSNKQILIIAIGAYIISLLSSSYYGLFVQLLDYRFHNLFILICMAFHPANSFIIALIYIVLGKYIAENERVLVSTYSSISLFAILLIVLILGCIEVYWIKWSVKSNDAFLFLPLFSFILFLLLIDVKINIYGPIAKLLRKLSILIYIIHPIIVYVNYIHGLYEKGPLFFIIVLLLSMLIAYSIIRVSDKIKLLRYLY